ncbi:glucans biosynthesis glucosyltransferase MdoH [Aeoliella sp. SH292]|uniref:glucans biosynthesis glucosyltransferase MdoH n=1 Tax=Aeoliella sp. SH292 TaxID=3454464 RepID=UPI003F9E069E
MSSLKVTAARVALVVCTLVLSFFVTQAVMPGMTVGGVSVVDVLVASLLFVLMAWLGLWCGVATIGFVLRVMHPPAKDTSSARTRALATKSNCTTAILMPVYNEDPKLVYAGLEAMRQSLADSGLTEQFHFFVLSDSTDPDKWLAEERQWQQLNKEESLPRVFYRHRPQNVCRKAGNIADFCTRWGAAYRYMVVLDADSLMEASVLAELVRRMEADRRLGILQTPPMPLGQSSLLARSQQFIARLCGPMLSTGLAWLAGDGSNYWGHNAIIRVSAFTRYCGLSELPGTRPLGGEILSHDFVEAALMRRAGYKVQLAADLAGSFEQSPSTLTAYAQRDQRWCQGNMQHTRLIASKDIPMENRFHFLTGVLAYGSSPLWAAFLLLSPIAFYHGREVENSQSPWVPIMVFGIVLALLFLPRLLGYVLAISDRRERIGFVGPLRLALGVMGELVLSILMAPILMTFHSLFVWSTFRGKSVEWNAQDRSGRGLSWGDAWSAHWWQTMLGIAVAVGAAWFSPTLALWLLPITTGLILAVPLSVLVSSKEVGERLKHWGWLLVPEERHPPTIVRRYRKNLAAVDTAATNELTFEDFLRDAGAVGQHLHLLEATAAVRPAQPEVESRVRTWLTSSRKRELARDEKWAVLSDPQLLEACHVGVWTAQA